MRKSKIFALVVLLVTVFAVNFDVVSAAPKTIDIKRSEVLSDLVTNYDHGFTIFTTKEGKYIYCLDNLKDPLKTGDVATDAGKADDGILYILRNGYPAKHITGNDEMDKYITQAAIWWYMDDTNQGSNQLSDEFRNATDTDIYDLIPDYIKPMVAKAKQYKDEQTKPSMDVNVEGTTLALTSDNQYYESRLISVNLVGASSYSAIYEGGTSGTAIVDVNGKRKTNFKADEKFKVRIPANELNKDTKVDIKITSTGIVQSAKIYKVSDTNYQQVVGLFDEETPLAKAISLTASPNINAVEVAVPNTSANILMISIAAGATILVIGIGIILYRSKQKNKA